MDSELGEAGGVWRSTFISNDDENDPTFSQIITCVHIRVPRMCVPISEFFSAVLMARNIFKGMLVGPMLS